MTVDINYTTETDCEHHKEFKTKKEVVKFYKKLKRNEGLYKNDKAINICVYKSFPIDSLK